MAPPASMWGHFFHATFTDTALGEQFFRRQAGPQRPHLLQRICGPLYQAQRISWLTSRQGNLLNIHSQKYSGLANAKVSALRRGLDHVLTSAPLSDYRREAIDNWYRYYTSQKVHVAACHSLCVRFNYHWQSDWASSRPWHCCTTGQARVPF
jgi:hypothetical protein